MALSLVDLSFAALTLLMAALVVWGVGPALRARVLIGVVAWLGATLVLAQLGVFARFDGPPRLPLVPLLAFATMVLLNRTAAMRDVLARTPIAWLLAAQSFRVIVELGLEAAFRSGRAPVQVTFEGRNLDIFVGLTAPVVAWLVHRGRASPMAVIGWNVAGLSVLANTVVTVLTSIPGPLHRDWPGAPFTEIASWPLVWLPAFLAPLAVALHVASLRQAFDVRRLAAPVRE